MKLGILVLSLGGLCIPNVVVAQTISGTGTMTTTPSVTCSRATGECSVNQDQRSLGTGAPSAVPGTLGNTTPGTTGGSANSPAGTTGGGSTLLPPTGGSMG